MTKLIKKNKISHVSKIFSWKKKSTVYIGRFQPFHSGHEYLFKKGLESSGQVIFLVMDSYGIKKKNPFKFSQVKKNILKKLKKYKNKFLIIKIPVVKEVIYGRKVGYKIKKIQAPKNITSISATNIRKNLFK